MTRLLAMLSVVLLTACAGQRAHREGLMAIEQGQWETGLAQLERAMREAPENLKYRADLLNKREQAVVRLLAAADARRSAGQWDEAEALYRRTLKLDSDNARARAALAGIARDRKNAAVLREARELAKKGDVEGAQGRLRVVLASDADNPGARALQAEIEERMTKDAPGAPRLKTQDKRPVTLQFRDAPIKMVFEALSRTSALNFILDKDVKGDLRTTIFVQNVQVGDAIDLILSQNQLAGKVLNENTLFVYPNTPAKLKDYQDQIVKTFYLTNVDAKQAMNMLKSVLNAKVTFVDDKSNLLILRDAPEAVRMAEKLIASLDLPEPEVMMEVEVLEVRRGRLMQLGIDYPGRIDFSPIGVNPDVLTVDDLNNLNQGRIRVSPISLGLDLRKEDSDTNVLASPRIRARNREKAKILIGDRVPVITNTVTPTTTGTAVVTGNVQYLDVGLKLDVEPTVHLDDDVAIKVNLEVSSIAREIVTQSGTIAYQIGTRNASTLLRLKDGETQILAGLISDEERNAASKIPGLGDLPLIGRLFSTHRDDKQKTEIVLSITPRLIRNLERPDAKNIEFWYGSESTLRTQPLVVEPAVPGNGTPPAPPAAVPRNSVPNGPAPANGTPAMTPAAKAAPPGWRGPALVRVGEQFELDLQPPAGGDTIRIDHDPAALQIIAIENTNDAGEAVDVAYRQGEAGQLLIDVPGKEARKTLRLTFKALAAKPQTVIASLADSTTASASHVLKVSE